MKRQPESVEPDVPEKKGGQIPSEDPKKLTRRKSAVRIQDNPTTKNPSTENVKGQSPQNSTDKKRKFDEQISVCPVKGTIINGYIALKKGEKVLFGCIYCSNISDDRTNIIRHVLKYHQKSSSPVITNEILMGKDALIIHYFSDSIQKYTEQYHKFQCSQCLLSPNAEKFFIDVFNRSVDIGNPNDLDLPSAIHPTQSGRPSLSNQKTSETPKKTKSKGKNKFNETSMLEFSLIPFGTADDDIDKLRRKFDDIEENDIQSDKSVVQKEVKKLLMEYKNSIDPNKMKLLAYSLVDLTVKREGYDFDAFKYINQMLGDRYPDEKQKFISSLWCDIAVNSRLTQSQITTIHQFINLLISAYGMKLKGSHDTVSTYKKDREQMRKIQADSLHQKASFTSIAIDSTQKNEIECYGCMERIVIDGHIIEKPLFVTTFSQGPSTGPDIAKSVMGEVKKYNVQRERMSGVTTDGDATMIGWSNGVAASIEKELKPTTHHFQINHCVDHRNNLCGEDLGDNQRFSVFEIFVRTVSDKVIRDQYEKFLVREGIIKRIDRREPHEPRRIPTLSNTRWLFLTDTGLIILEQWDYIQKFLMDTDVNKLFIKKFKSKVDAWEREIKIKDTKKEETREQGVETKMDEIPTTDQMVMDEKEKTRIETIEANEMKKREEEKKGKKEKSKKKTIKLDLKSIFDKEEFIVDKGNDQSVMIIENSIFKHIFISSLYLLWLLRLINIYFQNTCLFITEVKEVIDATVNFLTGQLDKNAIDIQHWVKNEAFSCLSVRTTKSKDKTATTMLWDPSKFDREIYDKHIKDIVIDTIKALKLRYTNPCFTWNKKSKKYDFNREILQLSYRDTDFKALHNYHLEKYLGLFYIPQRVFNGEPIQGNFSEALRVEIKGITDWLRDENNKKSILVTGEPFKEGSLSRFIKREKKYSLLDVIGRFGPLEYPQLKRCCEFICSLQPNTSRVESMFSVLKNTIQPNMYIENLESSMLLKLDRCGGIRKIFNN